MQVFFKNNLLFSLILLVGLNSGHFEPVKISNQKRLDHEAVWMAAGVAVILAAMWLFYNAHSNHGGYSYREAQEQQDWWPNQASLSTSLDLVTMTDRKAPATRTRTIPHRLGDYNSGAAAGAGHDLQQYVNTANRSMNFDFVIEVKDFKIGFCIQTNQDTGFIDFICLYKQKTISYEFLKILDFSNYQPRLRKSDWADHRVVVHDSKLYVYLNSQLHYSFLIDLADPAFKLIF